MERLIHSDCLMFTPYLMVRPSSRFVWILVFLSGICFSGYFCWQMWQKWEQSPMLTSVETHLYPLKNVPFPAVTICNVNKVSERKLHDAILGNPKSVRKIPFVSVNIQYLNSQILFITQGSTMFLIQNYNRP